MRPLRTRAGVRLESATRNGRLDLTPPANKGASYAASASRAFDISRLRYALYTEQAGIWVYRNREMWSQKHGPARFVRYGLLPFAERPVDIRPLPTKRPVPGQPPRASPAASCQPSRRCQPSACCHSPAAGAGAVAWLLVQQRQSNSPAVPLQRRVPAQRPAPARLLQSIRCDPCHGRSSCEHRQPSPEGQVQQRNTEST